MSEPIHPIYRDGFNPAPRPATIGLSGDIIPALQAESTGTIETTSVEEGTTRPSKLHQNYGEEEIAIWSSALVEFTQKFLHPNNTGNSTAFEDIEARRHSAERIRNKARNLIHSNIRFGLQLAHRLEFLVKTLEEEGEEWSDDSYDSLNHLIEFIKSKPALSEPEITVTPDVLFRAQWTRGSDEHFAVTFYPDGQVSFVIFSPDLRHCGRVQRVSGLVSWDSLFEKVTPYNIKRWIYDDRRHDQ